MLKKFKITYISLSKRQRFYRLNPKYEIVRVEDCTKEGKE